MTARYGGLIPYCEATLEIRDISFGYLSAAGRRRSRLSLGQRLSTLDDPLRKNWRTLRRLAHANGPMLQPTRAFFSKIGIRQTIGRVGQSVGERNETVPAL